MLMSGCQVERKGGLNLKLALGRPKTYAKGPDIASKSGRTQRRYKKQIATQGMLDFFPARRSHPVSSPVYVSSRSPSPPQFNVDTMNESQFPLSPNQPESPLPLVPIVPIPNSMGDICPKRACIMKPITEDTGDSDDDEDEEIDELMQGLSSRPPSLVLPGWPYLCNEIDKVLEKEKKARCLPYSQLNQYQLLRSFATLRIKGLGRIAASIHIAQSKHTGDGVWFARRIRMLSRHFQKYEHLPIESRGGRRKGSCQLEDEDVERAAGAGYKYKRLVLSLHLDFVMPSMPPSSLISVLLSRIHYQTVRPSRWMFKLGFRQTTLRKGVYMDGHECEDVVRYRNEIFLPAIAKFESCMTRYEGEDLKKHEPSLQPGEKRIITQFHDESCFHVNEFKLSACRFSKRRARGRLIHVSDFINEEDGRLVQRNEHGKIIRDARKVIYPGASGDSWWDTEQLLTQVDISMDIFNSTHPDCQALFIFDQSSAHASLGPDALRAFDMNKGNVIPDTNPMASMRGKPQKLTTERGDAKGLQDTLEECGFDTQGMCAKCAPICPFENDRCCMARLLSKQDDFVNQISMLEAAITARGHLCLFLPKFHLLGLCKVSLLEVFKTSFAEAKEIAIQSLDACPIETIQRFINRSWRFMSAYHLGLTGKAAEWAVRKQKSHHSVCAACYACN
ncbi:hypothetical protein BS47DRAFT_1374479 [Hydnum rufescens UP504]|uniref:Uncharacterized protein n=1 Tax=Hydnum rufescens UP504 TaxID=1448309 RepID=A0A9P6DLP7_9AGAM|nr:hypothetical protein BS47DRAFT_1374479 [Hydnum rufescens UP504]